MKKIFLLLLLSAFQIPMVVRADDLVKLAERETIRRQENVKKGERLVVRAERAVSDKNLELAYKEYLAALELIPSGSATSANRQAIVTDFSKTAVAYASNLIERGYYAEAADVAKTVLSPQFNPNYRPAAEILSRLEKKQYNTTIDPEFSAERRDTEKLLLEAEGFYNTGRNDLAIKRYEQALNLDPYNTAARQGMEQVNRQRSEYYDETYNETRSRMLWLVDRAWEKPVRKLGGGRSTESASLMGGGRVQSKDDMMRKLTEINIENISLNDVTIREAVEILKQKSRQYDTTGDKKKGVNIVLKIPAQPEAPAPGEEAGEVPATPVVTEDSKVNLDLKNVPLIEAIRYLTELTGLKQKVDEYAVSLIPATESTEELLVKEYRVTPGFIPTTPPSETEESSPTGESGNYNQKLKGVRNATEYLKQQDVPFPPGAFAQYIPSGSKLVVRNTQSAIDQVDALVEADVGVKPTQVEIESKFVEISQNNVNELGFDWLLGPFSIGGGVYGDGGTRGGGGEASSEYYNNFPFSSVGSNPITAGNRSGIGTNANSAITANSLDALIAGIPQGANVASPAIFGIAGVFTNPQFQMVIRALSQQKGVDLMSAPKVTTKSGNSATIKIIRQFPYPTEFDPPEVPQSTGGGVSSSGSGNTNSSGASIVSLNSMITPSTPVDFENRDLGVLLEVAPEVGADNYTIDLSLTPEVVEFDGFINYGSPVIGPVYDPSVILTGDPSGIGTYEITPNVMNQPVFSIRRINTQVSIWDGQTVAMGGLIREDVQKVNDKVPILGDIPLAGRLFRSNVDQKIKKNLIVFVTARLLDAAGQPLIQEDEAEEFVEPKGAPNDLPQPRIETRSVGK